MWKPLDYILNSLESDKTNNNKKLIYPEIVRDADVGAHSLSLQSNQSSVYNLRQLTSHMHYLFIYLFISISI